MNDEQPVQPIDTASDMVEQPDSQGDSGDQENSATETSMVGNADAADDQAGAGSESDIADVAAPEMEGASASTDRAADTSTQGDDMADSPAMPMDAGDDAPASTAQASDRGTYGDDRRGDQPGDSAQDEIVIHSTRDPRLNDLAPNASMEDLMKASEQQYRTLKHGDVIEGTVMRVDRDEILVDIGAKTEGVIPSRESQTLSEEERQNMQIGDEVFVSVVQPESTDGHAILSVDRARQEKAWRDLQKKFDASEVIQAQVVGHNKGGLLVNLDGVRGFVPSSQISSMPPGEANKQAELAKMHNQTISLKVIEINRPRNRLILSERQAMQEQREAMRARLLQELEPGQIRPGTVTSICDFGAFVDIGGADGLIHLSELSWKRVSHPREVLYSGERINVYVLSIDTNERKIALSLKRTQPEPWDTITDTYQLGQVVRGTITQVTSFGAFARLEDGIEGLIHVSELAEGRVAHPKNVVKEGDTLDLKVIRIDPAKKRIGLSLKRMTEDAPGDMGDGDMGEGSTQATLSAMGYGEEDAGSESGRASDMGRTEQSRSEQFSAQQSRSTQTAPSQPRAQESRPARTATNANYRVDNDDDAPLGALAQALAAHTQAIKDQDLQEAEAADQPDENVPDENVYDTGPLSEIATDIDAGAYATQSLTDQSDMHTKELSSDVDVSASGEGTDANEEPAAMMPSAADTDAAVADTADAPDASDMEAVNDSDTGDNLAESTTSPASAEMLSDIVDADDTSGADGEAGDDAGAISGSEGMPSMADSSVDAEPDGAPTEDASALGTPGEDSGAVDTEIARNEEGGSGGA